MKLQTLLIALTVANIALLILFLSRSASERVQSDVGVLRGRAP